MGQFNAQKINELLCYMSEEDTAAIHKILDKAEAEKSQRSIKNRLLNKVVKLGGYCLIQDVKNYREINGGAYVDIIGEYVDISHNYTIYKQHETLSCMAVDYLLNNICPYQEYHQALVKLKCIIKKQAENFEDYNGSLCF